MNMAKKPAKKAAKAAPKTEAKTAETNQQARPPQVMIHAQYVKDLSFENPNAVAAHLEPGKTPQVEIGVQVNGDKVNDHQYEVRLHLTAKASTDEKALFLVDLTYAGIVSAPDATPEQLNPLIMIEGPRLLFPFARSIVSNMTRDGGFLPLNLQPVDFVAVYRHSLEAQRKAAEEATKQ
jgi:preprotein translocase subunit SecB